LAQSNPSTPLNVGFLTVLHEPSGYLGGYLVTNNWGRPLEFRLSTAVQPNRVQQILYGGTLEPYICADLIGKTLVDKASVPVQLIVTERESVLDLRLRVDAPVIWLAPAGDALAGAWAASVDPIHASAGQRGAIFGHPRYPQDASAVREMLDRLQDTLDLAEPFVRIREAIGEARKMGVTKCA
jgi:hypothetical protein